MTELVHGTCLSQYLSAEGVIEDVQEIHPAAPLASEHEFGQLHQKNHRPCLTGAGSAEQNQSPVREPRIDLVMQASHYPRLQQLSRLFKVSQGRRASPWRRGPGHLCSRGCDPLSGPPPPDRSGCGSDDPSSSCLLSSFSRHKIRQPVSRRGDLLWRANPSCRSLAAFPPPSTNSHQERDSNCHGSEVSSVNSRRVHRVPTGVN